MHGEQQQSRHGYKHLGGVNGLRHEHPPACVCASKLLSPSFAFRKESGMRSDAAGCRLSSMSAATFPRTATSDVPWSRQSQQHSQHRHVFHCHRHLTGVSPTTTSFRSSSMPFSCFSGRLHLFFLLSASSLAMWTFESMPHRKLQHFNDTACLHGLPSVTTVWSNPAPSATLLSSFLAACCGEGDAERSVAAAAVGSVGSVTVAAPAPPPPPPPPFLYSRCSFAARSTLESTSVFSSRNTLGFFRSSRPTSMYLPSPNTSAYTCNRSCASKSSSSSLSSAQSCRHSSTSSFSDATCGGCSTSSSSSSS
eukprot:Rhum_TRINITY_DN14792_c21_g1::Rhum_TRINITY_DN14792_c21_g1_i1::g.118011::m.118011